MNFIKISTRILLFLFLYLLITPSTIIHGDETGPFPLKRIVIHGNGFRGPYSTGQRFIGGTVSVDSISAGDLSVADWNDLKGTVTFNLPIAAGDSVAVTFAVPPLWIKETYRRPKSDKAPGPGLSVSYSSYREKIPRPFTGLRFGGSKTFDINAGTDYQAAINQTLRLNISGNLTDDISLNAVVSDQNIPITPEGDTRELTELDRVLIELKGPSFSVDMGDTDLKNDLGRWLSYSRRLSGARATFKIGNTEFFGSGAVSEGRYMSTTISPIEGNQGPYRLIAENGRSDIAIIPGTERVWINGEQLTRGINYGYTIDYETGEITFTENRIIGSDMRIVCDYEYTSESFRRTFYSAGTNGTFLDKRIKFGVVVAHEADDPDRPVLGDLDESMRRALSQSGDSPATVTGIRPAAGDTTGTYDFVGGRFVYNPLKQGGYNVTFSWAGENSGTYRYLGGGIYEFVPPEERTPGSGASYDPVAVIQSPESHTLMGISLVFDPVSSIHVESELAGSSVDQNILSDKDDSDNNGGAYSIGMTFSPSLKLVVPLKLTVRGNYRARDRMFKPLDRDRAAEENRRWGLPLVMQPGREIVSEYTGGVIINDGRFSGSGVDFISGRTELGGSALSTRTGIESRMLFNGRGEAHLGMNHIVREHVPGLPDETIDRLTGETRVEVAGFTPSISYEGERTEGRGSYSHGTAYSEVRAALRSPGEKRLVSGVEWFYRTELSRKRSWEDSSTVRGGSIELSADTGVAGMMRARYGRRERIGNSHHSTTDQALLEGFFRPENGMVNLDYSYRAGRSRETSKRKNYIYAGGDRGSYRWEDYNNDGVRDSDEFIPDEHGSYYLYEEILDDYRPVNVVNTYCKLGLNIPPEVLAKLTGITANVTSETSFEVNEKSLAAASDIFLLKLSRFRKKGKTTSGDARFQEDITFPVAQDGSVRLRLFRFNSYDAEYVMGAERRAEGEESLRLRLPLTENCDTEYSLRHAIYRRIMENRTSGNYRVASFSGNVELSYYPQAAVKTGISIGGGRDHDRDSTITARYYLLKPSLIYHFSGRGKIEASYTLTSVTTDNLPQSRMIPHTMARGRKEGGNHDISLICDYRLSQRMNLVATYTGRRFADRDFEHFAHTQLRAVF